MTKILSKARRYVAAMVLTVFIYAVSSPVSADDADGTRADMIKGLLPSVVNITVKKDVSKPASALAAAVPAPDAIIKIYVGSGFIIDPSGVIITKYHVVEGAFLVTVTLSDGAKLPARVVAGSREADLAVLSVAAGHTLPALHWGDSEKVEVGDQALIAGNPFGIGTSVSSGIISAVDRNMHDSPFDDYLQTDAAINHGNSGGPMFDMQGNVIGIATEILSPDPGFSGLGFVIPSHWAKFVVSQLQTNGWISPGWIGVKVQAITPGLAEALNLASPNGFIISNVLPGSPAQAAELRIGGVVLTLDGQTPTDPRAFLRHIVETPIGSDITLSVMEGTSVRPLRMKVARWPEKAWERHDAPVPIVRPGSIPADLGMTLGTKAGVDGVLVTRAGDSPQLKYYLITPGATILRVQNNPVTMPQEVQTAIDTARSANKGYIAMLVFTGRTQITQPEWVALRLNGPE
jgi:serine protease Do